MSRVVASFVKDPNEVLDYKLDWSSWLGTDTIATSAWTLESGITESSSTNTTTTATIFISGGTNSVSYLATNRITTAGGRTADRSIRIKVKEQ